MRDIVWSVSSRDAANLIPGEEATINANKPVTLSLIARSGSRTAEAHVKVLDADRPIGSAIWTNDPIAGCRATHVVPANPVNPTDPDIYTTEDCDGDQFLRAFAHDGRELWRRSLIGTSLSCTDPGSTASSTLITLSAHSACGNIPIGLDKQHLLANLHKLHLLRTSGAPEANEWTLEGDRFRCRIKFDAKTGLALTATTIIAND